jgi:hypothetical protein
MNKETMSDYRITGKRGSGRTTRMMAEVVRSALLQQRPIVVMSDPDECESMSKWLPVVEQCGGAFVSFTDWKRLYEGCDRPIFIDHSIVDTLACLPNVVPA